jgi:hypothetical protein
MGIAVESERFTLTATRLSGRILWIFIHEVKSEVQAGPSGGVS